MENLTNLELLMEYMEQNQYFIGNDLLAKYNELLQKEKEKTASLIDFVIWRCTQNIQDICGETIFTKGLIYEQVKDDEYPMMLIDNKVRESEVYNLKDYFTSI